MRLIDADKAIEFIKEMTNREYRRKEGTLQDALKFLSSEEYTPTVDVESVRHGKWYEVDLTSYRSECSICSENVPYPSKYCPNCGAKMDMK